MGRKQVSAILAPAVLELVHRYLRARVRFMQSRTRHLEPLTDDIPYLWITSWKRPMDRHGVGAIVRGRSKSAGIDPPLSPHSLRRGYAVEWLRGGGAINDLRRNMGHSDLKTTMEYTRYLEDERALLAREQFSPGRRLLE